MHMHMPNIHTHTYPQSRPEMNVFRKRHEGTNYHSALSVVAKERKRNIQKGDEIFQEKAIYILCSCKIHWQWLFWLIGFILLN